MPIVATDWSVTRSTGGIRYTGDDHGGASPSYASVIEFHRWLQDLADDATSSGDDELDITDELPSSRSTDNIIRLLGTYNIDDTAAEHLYDGSIIQGSGGTEEIYDGIVNFGNADVQIQIIQAGAVLSDDWWNFGGAGLNADAAQGISHRFMLKIRTSGADIDGRRLIGTCRRFNKTFSEFSINGTSRGNNVLALSDADDLNNETLEATVATWTNITNTNEGYSAIDVNNDTTDEFYYSHWNADTPTRSINDFYERMKWLTRDGSAETLYGMSGELFRGITHEIAYDGQDASEFFTEGELVTFGNGATGRILADSEAGVDGGTTGTMWIQLLTGVTPANNDTIAGATCNALVNGTPVDRSALLKTPFIGQSTGTSIIGGYGVGIQTNDLTASDKLFDLTNAQLVPPNNVTFSVGGLVSAEDNVVVGPWDGVSTDNEGNPAIDTNQLSLNTTLAADDITSVVVTASIPSDTPSSGYIRVADDSGFYRRLHYSAWSGTTFTIDTTDGQEDFLSTNATAGNNVWISYIDTVAGSATETFTSVYNSDRDLVVKVRDGGGSPIKEFITSATLGSNGGSVTAIRTSDT